MCQTGQTDAWLPQGQEHQYAISTHLYPACTRWAAVTPHSDSSAAVHCIAFQSLSVVVLFAPSGLIDRGELNKAFSFSYHLKFKMFWNPLINSYNIENVVDDITYFWKLSSGGKLARLFLAKWYFQRNSVELEWANQIIHLCGHLCIPCWKILKAFK